MFVKKAAVFVDVVNMFYANNSTRLDYDRYLVEARRGRGPSGVLLRGPDERGGRALPHDDAAPRL